MPSRRHQLLARVVPLVRRSRDLDDVESERARIEAWHRTLEPGLPTRLVPRFERRFSVVTEQVGGFDSFVITPRGSTPRLTLAYLHGGGFMAPTDPFQVRWICRLARALDARVVLPDYPLMPEHTWRVSHDALVGLVARWTADSPATVLVGDSAGGGLALALAQSLRDAGGPRPDRMVLVSPWVDLTTSAPETEAFSAADPWLFMGKVRAYAEWWAGSPADLARPEVSPALGVLDGLPPTLMFCGTRDTLTPGCRLLADRAAASDWDLTYLERPGLLHVYPLLPGIPEAGEAFRQTLAFLR